MSGATARAARFERHPPESLASAFFGLAASPSARTGFDSIHIPRKRHFRDATVGSMSTRSTRGLARDPDHSSRGVSTLRTSIAGASAVGAPRSPPRATLPPSPSPGGHPPPLPVRRTQPTTARWRTADASPPPPRLPATSNQTPPRAPSSTPAPVIAPVATPRPPFAPTIPRSHAHPPRRASEARSAAGRTRRPARLPPSARRGRRRRVPSGTDPR